MRPVFGLIGKTSQMKLSILTLFMSAVLITSNAQTQTRMEKDSVSLHDSHSVRNKGHHHRRSGSDKHHDKHSDHKHKRNNDRAHDHNHAGSKHHK